MLERVAVVYAVKTERWNRSGIKRKDYLVVPFLCVKGCHVKMGFFVRRLGKSV